MYLRQLDTTAKNQALSAMAQALLDNEDTILAANVQDLNNGKATGLSAALLDRLSLDHDFATSDGFFRQLNSICLLYSDGGMPVCFLNEVLHLNSPRCPQL